MTDAIHDDKTGSEEASPDHLANDESATPELTQLLEVDTTPSNQSVWADLSMQVPNDLPSTRVASFVGCVLVELRHEPIAAVYRSNEEWGTIDTITVHSEWTTVPTDDPFLRCRRDPRLGLQVSPCSRRTVRDALVDRLTRDGAVGAPVVVDSFAVHPLSTIRRWEG